MRHQKGRDKRRGPMKRKAIITVLGTIAAMQIMLATAAFAATAADQIVAQLRDQGFSQIEVERTWLGRTRILAQRGDASREIIFNPATGEILRDLWLSKGDKSEPNIKIRSEQGGGNSGHGGGDDDDDEDEDDEDEDSDGDEDQDDDNSGSGGGSD